MLLRCDYLVRGPHARRSLSAAGRRADRLEAPGATQIVAAHVPAGALPAARAVVEGAADPRTLPGSSSHEPEATVHGVRTESSHKAAPPVVLAARPERAAALERHLFDGSYKGVTDLVTKWVWPRPARAVTGFCARARRSRSNAVTRR